MYGPALAVAARKVIMCRVREAWVVHEDADEERPPAGPTWCAVAGLVLLAALLLWSQVPGGFLIWLVTALGANEWSRRRGDRVPLLVHTMVVALVVGGLIGLAGLGVTLWLLVG